MSVKFNEGQYGFKPWMANLTMGLLEVVMVVLWFLGSLLSGLSAMLSLDVAVMDSWDVTTTLILCGAFLFWNCLVWFIAPLRTKFNYSETWYNVAFIGWLLFTTFFQG